MPKPDRDQILEAGEGQLGAWGVAPSVDAATLGAWIGRSAEADLAIAHRLGGIASEESLRLLRDLEHATRDKLVGKEVKRALYRLEQRGLRAPVEPAPHPAPVLASPIEGYLSAVDGAGDQLVWILKPRSDGLAHFFAVLNDPDGLRESELNVISRKGLKALREELVARHEIRLVPADWRYCDFLVARAFRWARERDTPMQGDYPALRAQLVTEPAAGDLPPLVWSHLSPLTADEEVLLRARSNELLAQPEFRTWSIDSEKLRRYVEALTATKDSPLVLNPEQQRDRVTSLIRDAVEELFGGELRESYARRLFDMAYFFAVTNRVEAAKIAASVAKAIAAGGTGCGDIPFCQDLVWASLHLPLEEQVEADAERESSSLLVTPQQFLSEADRRRR